MCVYVFVCVYMCLCVYVCICVCVYVCVYVCVCMYVGQIVLFITALVLQLNKSSPTVLLSGVLNYLGIFRRNFCVTPVVVAE